MLTRRNLMLTGGASALALLAGCGREALGPFTPLPPLGTDIHAHFFNGRDIPLTGFVSQVVLRPHGATVTQELLQQAVISLISAILFGTTSSPATELAKLNKLTAMPAQLPEAQALASDQQKVAEGIRRYSTQPVRGFSARAQVGRDTLLEQLNNLAAGRDADIATRLQVQDRADQIAEAIYNPPPFRLQGLGPRTPDQTVLQLVKWAGMLTRDRRYLLEEYKRLYGREMVNEASGEVTQEIQIVSPSLVDFDYFLAEERNWEIDVLGQIEVMSRLAYLENDLVLLNFAPFCPLKAAIQRKRGVNWLVNIQRAVTQRGFVGIKLYPPMGFKPLNNEGVLGQRSGLQATGAEVDRELRRLYAWCVAEDVPIKAHGNNSLGATVCSGLNAAPVNWQAVLNEYPDLRLNVAHFGGFDETHNHGAALVQDCKPGDVDYEDMLSALVQDGNNVYADLGYWSDVTGTSSGVREKAKVKALLGANSRLQGRIMYGSDWSMIGQEVGHGAYLNQVKAAIAEVGLDTDAVMSRNALSYLGLEDRRGKQMQRLSRFFPAGHRFYELFGP